MVHSRYRLLLIVLGTLLAACHPAEIATESLPTSTLLPFRVASSTPQPTPAQDVGPGSTPLGPTPTPFVHIVQQGETLLGIALRYGVALDDLILVNPGVDPGFLTIGQQLRIPGEEGEAVDTLLPTPTPVPVEMSPVECYESPSGALACLLEAQNNDAEYVRGLTVVVRLYDGGGEEIGVQLANSPLEFLSPGKSLPLLVQFPQTLPDFSYATASVQSAIRIPSSDITGYSVGLEIQSSTQIFDARMSRVVGTIDLRQLSTSPDGSIRILGIVRSPNGHAAGYRILDLVIAEATGDSIPFSLDIFSLGPSIDSVEVIAQARPLQ